MKLTDEQIEQLAHKSGLGDEMWFGPSTPKGYKDCLPELRNFIDSALSLLRSALEGGEPVSDMDYGNNMDIQVTDPNCPQHGGSGMGCAELSLMDCTCLASIPPITPVEAGKVGDADGVNLVCANTCSDAKFERKPCKCYPTHGVMASAAPLSEERLHELATAAGFGFFGQWQLYQGARAELVAFARAVEAAHGVAGTLKENGNG